MKPILYSMCRHILTPIVYLLYNPVVKGKENIQKKEGTVLAGNHTSFFDAIILGYAFKKDLYYIVKKELHEGHMKWFFKAIGTIPVDRKNKNNDDSLSKAKQVLSNNKTLVIFPEGTINKTEKTIMPFKYGAVSLANKTNSYILPFAIKGKFKLFKRSISINIGKPFKVSEDLEKENKKLEKEVIYLLKEGTFNEKRRT